MRIRFRCFCVPSLFIRLFFLTLFAYLTILHFIIAPKRLNHEHQRHNSSSGFFIGTSISVHNRQGNQQLMPIYSFRPAWKVRDLQTTESMTNLSESVSSNYTEFDNGQVDTGIDYSVQYPTIRQGEIERQVRREVTRLHLRQPTKAQHTHGNWQVLEDEGNIHIYSAFYDSRPNLDWPQVRITAVAKRDVSWYKLCCLLWYRSQRLPGVSEIIITDTGVKFAFPGQLLFGQYIISCRTDANASSPPTAVSIVETAFHRVSNVLPVQVPERTGKVLEFGICMKTMYWKQDPFRLVEWLEAHRVWGVGEVTVYATKVDNITDQILRRYSQSGFVRYRVSPGPFGDDDKISVRMAMSAVLNDCLYRNMYRYRYVLCTDLDEMIVPTITNGNHNYADVLRAADAAATRTNAIVHSYAFRNTYFFLDFGSTAKEPWFLLTQRYTKRVGPSRYGYAMKSITRTLSCVALQNHYCWQSLPMYVDQPNWHVDVPAQIAKSHHYKKCHFDEFLRRNGVCGRVLADSVVTDDDAALRFGDRLAPAVADMLLSLGLVEVASDSAP